MRIHLSLATIAIFGVLGMQAPVWGQLDRFSGSSSGMFGSRTIGGGITPNSGALGGMGIGATSPMSSGAMGNVGATAVPNQYVRGSQQAGQFVGADTRDWQSFVGAAQTAAAGMGRQMQAAFGPRGAGAAGRGGQPGGRAGAAGRARRGRGDVRTALSVGFDYPRAASATRASTALTALLARTERIRAVSPVKILVQDGTATLRGVVATDHDRDLVEQLARLEAGIWEVKNELVVAARPAATDNPLPAEPAANRPEETPAADSPTEPAGPVDPFEPIPEPPALEPPRAD